MIGKCRRKPISSDTETTASSEEDMVERGFLESTREKRECSKRDLSGSKASLKPKQVHFQKPILALLVDQGNKEGVQICVDLGSLEKWPSVAKEVGSDGIMGMGQREDLVFSSNNSTIKEAVVQATVVERRGQQSHSVVSSETMESQSLSSDNIFSWETVTRMMGEVERRMDKGAESSIVKLAVEKK